MKTFRQLLILSFFIHCSFSFAFNCIGKNDSVAPTLKEGAEWEEWKNTHLNWESGQNWKCCDGLKTEGRKCLDPSITDSSLQSCTHHNQCAGPKGCYPWREDDMFSDDSDDPAVEQALLDKEKDFEAQSDLRENRALKNVGDTCLRNFECGSYKCERFYCVENKICRKADKDELAPASVECEEPYVKNSSGVCKNVDEAFYALLLPSIIVQQLPDKQCQFQLTSPNLTPQDVTNAANLGLLTMRSMEWLFATASHADVDDCLFSTRWIKKKMKDFAEQRKLILSVFNSIYLKMEEDYKKVSSAQSGDLDTHLVSPCGGTTTAHDIANRRSTGVDYLCYIHNRNEFFMAYEKQMRELTQKLETDFVLPYKKMFQTKSNDTQWSVGEWQKDYLSHTCRGKQGGLREVKNRWGVRYKVRGKHQSNESVIKDELTQNYLKFIQPDDFSHFSKTRFWLLDPLMPGNENKNVDFKKYGVELDSYRRKLIQDNGLDKIKEGFRTRIIDYFKNLKPTDSSIDFIYEPEIPSSYEFRGCVDKIGSPECEKFSRFINNIQNVSMAQFLAYSFHYKKRYKKYFEDEKTWRRMLFDRIETDLLNMQMYYDASIELREKQNQCAKKVIDQIFSPDFSGDNMGVDPRTTNYYQAPPASGQGANLPTRGGGRGQTRRTYSNPYQANLNSFNTSGLRSSTPSITDSSAGMGSGQISPGQLSQFAVRMSEMKAANEKVIKNGTKFANLDKALRKDLSQLKSLSSSSQGGNLNQTMTPLQSQSPSSPDSVKESEKSSDNNMPSQDTSRGSQGGFNASGANAFESSVGSSGRSDASGMSDEEKDIMAANYERSKSQYKPNEDDSLFEVLSKSYVRNLDKILIRKKKLEEESAPGPLRP